MNKTQNNKAWWLLVPVLILVAFNAFIPLMTVVNYAFQETFGDNIFFWEGTTWFEQVLRSSRFHDALIRQFRGTWSERCGISSRCPTSACLATP